MQEEILSSSLAVLQNGLESVRDELDDHRETINDTTGEVETVYEFLSELDSKLDRVQSMVEELHLLVKGTPKQVAITPLTAREKSVCQAIYVLGQTKPFVSYDELVKHLGFTRDALASTIASLASKHVPFVKKYNCGRAYVQLRPDFRQQQAKHNVIKADCLLQNWMG